jgi:hypothetical protein
LYLPERKRFASPRRQHLGKGKAQRCPTREKQLPNETADLRRRLKRAESFEKRLQDSETKLKASEQSLREADERKDVLNKEVFRLHTELIVLSYYTQGSTGNYTYLSKIDFSIDLSLLEFKQLMEG